MGYNKNCWFQTCSENCCNLYGVCPSTFADQFNDYPNYTKCYYYYGMDPEAIIGIIAGVLGGLLLVTFIVLLCICIRKKRQPEQVIIQQQPTATAFPPSANAGYQGGPTYLSDQNVYGVK